MTFQKGLKSCLLVLGGGLITSCAWIPAYISEPSVEIERVPTGSGRVASANFWQDGQRVILRGEIIPRPISKSPPGGHVHAAIIGADGQVFECKTTHQRMRPRHVRKPHSMAFDALPAAGGRVQVYHHFSAAHDSCTADEVVVASS